MTDGAARVLEGSTDPTLKEAFNRLTTRDVGKFWTSGQWMTERAGGSDVSMATETRAEQLPQGSHEWVWVKSNSHP